MRIRKSNKLAFGLPPDPHQSSRSPVVQLQHQSINNPHRNLLLRGDDHGGGGAAADDDDDTAAYYNSHQPSDHEPNNNQPITSGTNAHNHFNSTGCGAPAGNRAILLQEKEEEEEEEGERSNDTRKGSGVAGGGIQTVILRQSSSSSNQAAGKWVEGETGPRLKRRRKPSSGVRDTVERGRRLNRKMTGKWEQQSGNNFGSQEVAQRLGGGQKEADGLIGHVADNGEKKRGRGGALMEGSRCSRVNGRGWRCCQQTLVGYSLCEHHLGKGRLRSMTSVRSRSNNAPPKKEMIKSSSSSSVPRPNIQDEEEDEKTKPNVIVDDKTGGGVYGDGDRDEDHDDKNPLPMSSAAKKKAKIGMVKARSISSLLERGNSNTDISNNPVAVAEANNE